MGLRRIAFAPRLMDVLDESNRDLSMAHFLGTRLSFFPDRACTGRHDSKPKAPPTHQCVSDFRNRGRISDYDDTGEALQGLGGQKRGLEDHASRKHDGVPR